MLKLVCVRISAGRGVVEVGDWLDGSLHRVRRRVGMAGLLAHQAKFSGEVLLAPVVLKNAAVIWRFETWGQRILGSAADRPKASRL